ncbi:uncharacterized protein LOC101858746 [Aplysia californica]|uniref:Uncharacterized protein LOC101858746 n=1 Tax=Aplysia californica TaxID=6500 RepID=A0ABM0K7J3_APLCA|nr:uncharacterized protein LOC101858746 [Aplysia californica]
MNAKVKQHCHDYSRQFGDQNSLMSLVESHDVAGLLSALGHEGAKNEPMFSVSLCPRNSKYSTREFLTKNKSAVERSCELGHLDILNLFLINGCSPNLPTSHGRLIHTVLTTLKTQRHLVDNGRAFVTLKLMLARNCDVNVKSFDHKSALMLACELADPAILKVLLRHCSHWQLSFSDDGREASPLQMVCMQGSSECVRILLKRLSPADINNSHGKLTPLLMALMVLRHNMTYISRASGYQDALSKAQHQLVAIVEMLLNAGADPNVGVVQDPRDNLQPPSFNAICCALDVANDCEAFKNLLSHEAKKLSFLYVGLVRLFGFSGATVGGSENVETLKERFPRVQSVISELAEFDALRQKISPLCNSFRHAPFSLMELSRKSIRLQVARCNKLGHLDNLPLPRKLKDYTLFLTF